MDALGRMIGQAREHIGEPSVGPTSLACQRINFRRRGVRLHRSLQKASEVAAPRRYCAHSDELRPGDSDL